MISDRPTLSEVAAEAEEKGDTSVVVQQVLPGGGTQYLARLPIPELADEGELLGRFGPGSYKLRYLDEGGKFKHSAEFRIAGESPPPPPRPPVVDTGSEVAELRRQVAELAALVARQAAPPAPPPGPPPPWGAAPVPAPIGSDLSGVAALAAAMSAPAQRMTEALLPILLQTIKPPDKDAGTAATETLMRGIELGRAFGKKGGDAPPVESYADVIRDVGVPLVNLLGRRIGGAEAPAAPAVEVDPVIAELAGHARLVATRTAGLGAAEAADLVDRVASDTVDGEVPGHPGVTWRELLTDANVRAAVGRVVPDVAQRAGWWEAFADRLWDLGASDEPETGGTDVNETAGSSGAGGEA